MPPTHPPPGHLNLWVVPYAGRNPASLVGDALCGGETSKYGTGTRDAHGMGGAAPPVGRFGAVSPLPSRSITPKVWGPRRMGWVPVPPRTELEWMVLNCLGIELIVPPPAGTRPWDTPVLGNLLIPLWVRYKAPRPPPGCPQHKGHSGGVTVPGPPTATPRTTGRGMSAG